MSDNRTICPKCSKNCTSGQKAVCCSICNKWLHQKCTDVDDAEYKFLGQMFDKRQYHGWKCDACEAGYFALQKQVEVLNNQMRDLINRVDSNSENISANSAKIGAIEERLTNVETNSKNSQNANPDSAIKVVFNELNERENKKNNIVIYNVAEPDRTINNGQLRKDIDLEKIKDIVNTIKVNINYESDIKFITRTDCSAKVKSKRDFNSFGA